MVNWADGLLYMFLGYIFFHLIVGDIVHIIKALQGGSPDQLDVEVEVEPNPQSTTKSYYSVGVTNGTVPPAMILGHSSESDIECQLPSRVFESTEGTNTNPTSPKHFMRKLASSEQRSVVLIAFKICDIVLYCLMGYFHTFTTCWCACINCLNVLILKYISFLEVMVTQLTAYPAVAYLCPTAVLCFSMICLIVYILVGAF